MKTYFSISCFVPALLSLSVLLNGPARASAAESGQAFATPEEAVTALHGAVSATNRVGLGTILGPAASVLVNPDEVQGAAEFAEFSAAFNSTNRLVRESESRMMLEVGPNAWPFPIPLVKVPNGWQFDTAAGVEELLNRRIGRNELDVLRVLRAYVQAQREYASRDRDGDGVLEFAQRINSSRGRTDGLFWYPEVNGEMSPLGPLFAYAQGEGYTRPPGGDDSGPKPFHGYLFKILTRQGKHAPGGKYDYVINGNMIGGFALVAWPAEYGDSGIMTFIVNQQGRVRQRDLGPTTARIVSRLRAYDPDKNWQLSPD